MVQVLRIMLIAGCLPLALASPAAAQNKLRVVASIPPVHSIAAAVMQGAGEPQLLLEGGASPHATSLKPSQARLLENAGIVFWIGPELESFLEKPLATIGKDSRTIELAEVPGVTLLAPREGGAFETHDHAQEEEDHDEQAHRGEEEHDHDEAHHGEHKVDPHIWLDPANAKRFAAAMAEALGEADPDNAELYTANAAKFGDQLDALSNEITESLKPLRGKAFIVFHDAYHYFENSFGIKASGAITVSPEVAPGVARLKDIRRTITSLNAACVFAEPQFRPALIATAIEGTPARSGILDPLGASLEPDPDLYFTLLRNMADSLEDCLSR